MLEEFLVKNANTLGKKGLQIRVLCCLSEDWNMELFQCQSVDVMLLERWNHSAPLVPIELMVTSERARGHSLHRQCPGRRCCGPLALEEFQLGIPHWWCGCVCVLAITPVLCVCVLAITPLGCVCVLQ